MTGIAPQHWMELPPRFLVTAVDVLDQMHRAKR